MRNPLRSFATSFLRFLARVAFAIWFGGFTFYAAVVVPDLHENLGGVETGEISRRVAPFLSMSGAAALALGWVVFGTDRTQRTGWRGKVRLGLLLVNCVLLITLVLMQRSLGNDLDTRQSMSAFRQLHEVYLTTWTAQWLAILGYVGLDVTPPIVR